MVSWEGSNGSDFYTASMQTESAISNMCMSDTNQCSVPGLICGHNFSVTVTASNQQCKINSTETASLQSGKILKGHHLNEEAKNGKKRVIVISRLEGLLYYGYILHLHLILNVPPAVPCAPTNVSMVTDCTNNTALVSWSPSLGAIWYMVKAQSHQNNVSCRTSDLTCNLDTLTCGTSYTIQVAAMDDSCTSIPSQVQRFHTGDTATIHLRQPNLCSNTSVAVAYSPNCSPF